MKNCYLCSTGYNDKLLACPNCKVHNFDAMSWIPNNVKQAYLEKWKIKKTEITPKLIESIFRSILKSYNVRPIRLKIKSGKTPLIEILSHNKEQTNLELIYDEQKLTFFDKDEIESLLYHEAFHALTSQRTEGILVPDTLPEMVDYFSDMTVAYEEYIDYKENDEYYSESEAFHRVKIKEIPNYDIIILNCKYGIANDMLATGLAPHQMVIKLFLDLVYYMLFHNDEIKSWALDNKITSLLRYYEWLVTDLEYIRRLNPDENKITELTRLIAQLSISFIVSEIILGNNIEFTAEAYVLYTNARNRYDDGKHNDELFIINLWIDRLNSTYN